MLFRRRRQPVKNADLLPKCIIMRTHAAAAMIIRIMNIITGKRVTAHIPIIIRIRTENRAAVVAAIMVMNIIMKNRAAAVAISMGTNIIITKIHAAAAVDILPMKTASLMKRLRLQNRNRAKAASRKK